MSERSRSPNESRSKSSEDVKSLPNQSEQNNAYFIVPDSKCLLRACL